MTSDLNRMIFESQPENFLTIGNGGQNTSRIYIYVCVFDYAVPLIVINGINFHKIYNVYVSLHLFRRKDRMCRKLYK